jgi:hypothetical protein
MPFLPDGEHYESHQYLGNRKPVSTNNFPLSPLLYGLSATNLNYAWPSNAIWPRIGLGTNIYKYSCEFLLPETLTVTPVYGSGFTLATNAIIIPAYGSTGAVVQVTESGSVSNSMHACLYEITSDSRPDKQYFVASYDIGTQYAGTLYWFSSRPAEMQVGDQISLSFGAVGRISEIATISAHGGISCNTNLFVFNKIDDSPYFSGSPRMLTVTATGPGSGILEIDLSGVANRIAIPVAFTNSSLAVSASKIAVPFSGSDFLGVTASALTNIVLHTNKSIKTNDLNDAKSVLQAMTRSICVLPYSAIECSSTGILCLASWSTNRNDAGMGISTAEVFPSVGDLFVNATAAFLFPSNGVPWGSAFAQIDLSAHKWGWSATVDGYSQVQEDADYYSLSYCRKLTDCRLPYPCRAACASNYVSHVSIYAVGYSQKFNYQPGIPALGQNLDTTGYSLSGNIGLPAESGLGFGVLSYPAKRPEFADAPGSGITETNAYFYNTGYGVTQFSSLRLSLVSEFDNPTGTNTFNFGGSLVWSSGHENSYDYEWTAPYGSGTENTYDREIAYNGQIDILAWVVVVDWNWKHLNETNPFEPAAYTPEWLSTNTP